MTKAAQKRIRAHISGRVQGVYYRASTREQAQKLGLVGWVRNTPDGRVALEAEGPQDALDLLVAWCHHGPPAAAVRDVQVEDVATRGDESEFRIRY